MANTPTDTLPEQAAQMTKEEILRAALVELLRSHKSLERTCSERVWPDTDGLFDQERQCAKRATKLAEEAIKKTAPEL